MLEDLIPLLPLT
jgi:hypothetical protein